MYLGGGGFGSILPIKMCARTCKAKHTHAIVFAQTDFLFLLVVCCSILRKVTVVRAIYLSLFLCRRILQMMRDDE